MMRPRSRRRSFSFPINTIPIKNAMQAAFVLAFVLADSPALPRSRRQPPNQLRRP